MLDLRAKIATSADCDLRIASEVHDMGTPFLFISSQRLGNGIPPAIQAVMSFFGYGFSATIPLGSSVMDREYRFAAIRIRDAVIATVPGEPIHELGLSIKAAGRAMGFQPALVFALANGHGAYFTTEPEYWAGGYEGLATLWGPQTGKQIEDQCVKMMGAVR